MRKYLSADREPGAVHWAQQRRLPTRSALRHCRLPTSLRALHTAPCLTATLSTPGINAELPHGPPAVRPARCPHAQLAGRHRQDASLGDASGRPTAVAALSALGAATASCSSFHMTHTSIWRGYGWILLTDGPSQGPSLPACSMFVCCLCSSQPCVPYLMIAAFCGSAFVVETCVLQVCTACQMWHHQCL